MAHTLDGELVRDDLRALAALVAVAVIAIVMRVDDGADLRCCLRFRLFHCVEHLARQRHVEQRIDQEAFTAIHDEPGIRPAPTAIRLQPGIAAVAEIVQTLGVLKPAQTQTHVIPLGYMCLPQCRAVRGVLQALIRDAA